MDSATLTPGERHALLRRRLGFNQPIMAKFLGCVYETISAIETDKPGRQLDMSDLARYHDAGISRAFLVGDSDSMLRDGYTFDQVRENILQGIKTKKDAE